MRIGIDGNLLTGNKTGMGHIVETVLLNIPESDNLIYLSVKEALKAAGYEYVAKIKINWVDSEQL